MTIALRKLSKVVSLSSERPSGFEQWVSARFDIAWSGGLPTPVVAGASGYAYRGLGLHLGSRSTSRYRRKDGTRRTICTWVVTHLNTGHVVYRMQGASIEIAFTAATDLAELADWDFAGLDGWRNADPDLLNKVMEWRARHGLAKGLMHGHRSHEAAQAIAAARS